MGRVYEGEEENERSVEVRSEELATGGGLIGKCTADDL